MAQPLQPAVGQVFLRSARGRTRTHPPGDENEVSLRALDDEISLAARARVPILVTADTLAAARRVASAIRERLEPKRMSVTTIECAVVGDSFGEFLDTKAGWIVLEDVGSLGDAAQALLFGFLGNLVGGPSGGRARHVRIISTALTDLYSCVKAGRFREALFYRLNTIHLNVPREATVETA